MQRGLRLFTLATRELSTGDVKHSFRASTPLIPTLLPTLADLIRHEHTLNESFRNLNPEKSELHALFTSLLFAIKKNYTDSAEIYLSEILKKGDLTDQIRDGIIAYAANQGKVEMISYLIAHFGEEAVLRYPLFKVFLAIPSQYENSVKQYLSQVSNPRREISFDNLKVCLAVLQDKIREQNAESEFKLAHTGLMNCETRQFKQDFTALMSQWKQEALATGETVIGTVLLIGRVHTSLMHLKIDVNYHHTADAKILYFNSTGASPGKQNDEYFQIPFAVFDESTAKVDLALAEDRLQKTHMGCTVFALHFYETLMNFDKIMAYNTQYTYANTPNAIFAYADHHRTHQFSYAYGKKVDECDVSYAGVITANLFSMPAPMTVGKQYYTYSELLLPYRPYEKFKYTQRADGRYQEESLGRETVSLNFWLNVNDQRKPIRGQDAQREALRLQEFDKPADITGTKTVNEVLDEVSVTQESGETVNIKNDQIRHELSFKLAQRLSLFAAPPKTPAESAAQSNTAQRHY